MQKFKIARFPAEPVFRFDPGSSRPASSAPLGVEAMRSALRAVDEQWWAGQEGGEEDADYYFDGQPEPQEEGGENDDEVDDDDDGNGNGDGRDDGFDGDGGGGGEEGGEADSGPRQQRM